MKHFGKLVALGAALAVSTLSAHAAAITGGITISGASTTNGTNSVTFSGTGIAINGTGTLAAADFDFINMISPLTAASVNHQLFNTSSGSPAISFLISSLSFTPEAGGQVQVNGTGTLSEGGYSDTLASFQLNTASVMSQSSFTLDTGVATTPEPSSLMLLGTGLTGAAGMLFRRRRSIA